MKSGQDLPPTGAGPGQLALSACADPEQAHPEAVGYGPQRCTPPPGLGLEKKEMAGVDHLVVYMQTAVKYSSLNIHHPGGASRPRGGVYRKCCILEQFAYTPPNGPHQPFPYFS